MALGGGVDGVGEERGRQQQQQQAASGCRRNAAAHASAAALAQTMAALLSIPSERPRWRFPPSANKGPGHPACPPTTTPNITQHLPQFPSIPPPAHLTPGPAEKTESFSPSPPSLPPPSPPPPPLLHLPVGAPFNHSASTIQYHSRRIGASRSVPSPSYRIFSLFCSSPSYISENRTSP